MDSDALARIRSVFVKQPIHRFEDAPPKAFFTITDFMKPVSSLVITDMADSLHMSYNFAHADCLVSIADRSSGPLCHELSRLTGLPYTLANWYPQGSPGDIEVAKCSGFSGSGHIYLNGLRRGLKVALVMDVLKNGRTALNLAEACVKAGCTLVVAAFGAQLIEPGAEGNSKGGRTPNIEKLMTLCNNNIQSVLKVLVRGERTKEELKAPLTAQEGRSPPNAALDTGIALGVGPYGATSATMPTRLLNPATAIIRQLKRLNRAEISAMMDFINRGFVGVPIIVNERLTYPYSFFQLTDFVPMMTPDVVETMADLCVHFGDFERCDVIVSEADRGGGPLVQAVARRTCKPFVMANWYPLTLRASGGANIASAASQVNVGFSGDGQIVVNGINPGDRCIFVDDMLSSGGTAEGVLRSVVKLGGVPLEGVFLSEKLYPAKGPEHLPERRGKARLLQSFPDLLVTTIVQFVADGTKTTAPQVVVG